MGEKLLRGIQKEIDQEQEARKKWITREKELNLLIQDVIARIIMITMLSFWQKIAFNKNAIE